MAAKTAFVGLLGGCWGSSQSSPPAQPANTTSSTTGVQPAQTCESYLGSLEVVTPDKLAADDPFKDKVGVYEAFSDRTVRASARTQECCNKELADKGSQAPARFACCSAVANAPAAACTPWGPPCPPEMS